VFLGIHKDRSGNIVVGEGVECRFRRWILRLKS